MLFMLQMREGGEGARARVDRIGQVGSGGKGLSKEGFHPQLPTEYRQIYWAAFAFTEDPDTGMTHNARRARPSPACQSDIGLATDDGL